MDRLFGPWEFNLLVARASNLPRGTRQALSLRRWLKNNFHRRPFLLDPVVLLGVHRAQNARQMMESGFVVIALGGMPTRQGDDGAYWQSVDGAFLREALLVRSSHEDA
jgi:hypothetical protein